ncbi:MAG: Thioesterase superfamily [uncultured Lysobacter sp.]|uniref:Thioesterase superfamily n=1 Tax=uncultured Lysobacter sp. TaxID=271060 RepID=A0A6J4LRT2_9GAMM|nr:MAG: Thioesterase superfamily [uncultured Lysobacter sp.]
MNDTPAPPAPAKRRSAPRKRKPAASKKTVAKTTADAPTVAADAAVTALRAERPRSSSPAMPAAAPPASLIRVPLSVRWRDLDAFNHVNNSKYLSYLEEARLRWMMTLAGMGLDDDVAPVVAASNLNYRRPIGWPGEVMVELFVERIGNTSVTVGHRILDASDTDTVYCDGNVVMVWIDRQNGRAAPLPEAVQLACRGGASKSE